VSVEEQSINLTDTLQSVDNIVLNPYFRFIGASYALDVDVTTSFDSRARNHISSFRYPNETREECLDRKTGSCGNRFSYSRKSIPASKKAACSGVSCASNSIRLAISISMAVRKLGG
jgi:hypothetical protein